jgi:hypothetical protein
MSDLDWDELVVCPTCKRIARPDEDEEDAHEQPCSNCGYTQMLIGIELHDDGRVDVSARWNQGEGPRLLLSDVERAVALADEFLTNEEAEDERIDDAMIEMRLARREAGGD